MGARIPAVFVHGAKVYVYSAVNKNQRYICMPYTDINLNEIYQIEIHQRYLSEVNYHIFVKVNGTEIHSVVNSNAQQFYNINVYVSDPWYDGFILFFEFSIH